MQEKSAQVLLNWLRRGISSAASVAEVQCYALGMGLTLRDIHTAQFCTDEDGNLQEGLPEFLVDTVLTMSKLEELLALCNTNSVHRPRPAGALGAPAPEQENPEHLPARETTRNTQSKAQTSIATTAGGSDEESDDSDAPENLPTQAKQRPAGRGRGRAGRGTAQTSRRQATVPDADKGDNQSDNASDRPPLRGKARKGASKRRPSDNAPNASDVPACSPERPAKRPATRGVRRGVQPPPPEAGNDADLDDNISEPPPVRQGSRRRGGGPSTPPTRRNQQSTDHPGPSRQPGTTSEPAPTRKRPRSGTTQDQPDLVIRTRTQRAQLESEEDGARRTRSQASGSRTKKTRAGK